MLNAQIFPDRGRSKTPGKPEMNDRQLRRRISRYRKSGCVESVGCRTGRTGSRCYVRTKDGTLRELQYRLRSACALPRPQGRTARAVEVSCIDEEEVAVLSGDWREGRDVLVGEIAVRVWLKFRIIATPEARTQGVLHPTKRQQRW